MKKGVGSEGTELITADRNNERKFRFLSEVQIILWANEVSATPAVTDFLQITKPDYREVSQREDYERIKKEEDIRNKMNEILSQRLVIILADYRNLMEPKFRIDFRQTQSVTSGSTDALLSPMESPVMRDRKQQKTKLSDSVPLARISLSSGDEMPMEDEENRPPLSASSAPPGTFPCSPYARNGPGTTKSSAKPPKSPATSGSSVGAAETRSRNSCLLGTDDSSEGMIIEGMEEDFDGRAVLAVTPRTNGIAGAHSQPVSPRCFPTSNTGAKNDPVRFFWITVGT